MAVRQWSAPGCSTAAAAGLLLPLPFFLPLPLAGRAIAPRWRGSCSADLRSVPVLNVSVRLCGSTEQSLSSAGLSTFQRALPLLLRLLAARGKSPTRPVACKVFAALPQAQLEKVITHRVCSWCQPSSALSQQCRHLQGESRHFQGSRVPSARLADAHAHIGASVHLDLDVAASSWSSPFACRAASSLCSGLA